MRLADIAIDLAAVVRASRKVAAKHAALRSSQWDAYSRTSSVAGVAAGIRERAADSRVEESQTNGEQARGEGAQASGRGQDIHTKTSPHVAPQQEPLTAGAGTRHAGLGQGIANPALSSVRHTVEATSTVSTGAEIRARPSPAPSPHVQPPPRAAATPELEAKVGEETADVPPGVNVDVFRTSRGSKILGALKQKKEQRPPQYPAPWSGLSPEPTKQPKPEVETVPVSRVEAIAPTPKPEPEAVAPDSVESATPSAVEEALPNPLGGKPYVLRESKVPATRASRLWNYSGLAAGMLGGAITEGLSRTFGGGGQGSVMLSGGNMERLVAKLSRMRGAALKLGQMMSFQDSKMLPGPIQEVLQRVQDRADYMPSYQRDQVLVSNLGSEWRDLFADFEEKPIAAASIGQVHKATLKSGKQVAVKIQFPGVADSINSDLDNLSMLLTATKLLPKGLYLEKTIDNARTELGWECDYEREAQCLTRFKELMAGEEDVFLVPDVHAAASGRQVLTMDFMEGMGVTRVKSFTQSQRDWIGTQILRLCLREISEFRFMQTDPNWTNFLYNERLNKLELLDFGASREYPSRFVDLYVRLLEAASRRDRAGVKNLSEDLGYLTGHESKLMLDAHVDSVLTLAEPFLASAPDVYDFKDQTITERVKGFIPVMLRERLAPPPEETYSLHRKLSGAFLLCARLGSRVPCKELFEQSLDKAGIPRGKSETS